MGSAEWPKALNCMRNPLKSEIFMCLIKYVGRKSHSYKNFNRNPPVNSMVKYEFESYRPDTTGGSPK